MNGVFDYASLGKNADRLIYQFGDACIVVTFQDIPAPNPINPPIRQKALAPTRGVFLRYKAQDIDGINIQRDDQVILLPSSVRAVDIRGLIIRGSTESSGEKWQVIGFDRLKPGPVGLIWKVQVRQ